MQTPRLIRKKLIDREGFAPSDKVSMAPHNNASGADSVKIAVLRKGRAKLKFI